MIEHNMNMDIPMTARHAQMVERLMARFGGAAVLSRVERVEPQFPWDPGEPVTALYDVQLAELGTDLDLQAGTLIEAGDFVGAMKPHPDVTPEATDKITVGGLTYNLISVRLIRTNPELPPLYFVLHGRR